MQPYLISVGIGFGLSALWVIYLLGLRAVIRSSTWNPGAGITPLQIGVVVLLMLGGSSVSAECFKLMKVTVPSEIIVFRRIWIVLWAIAMIASMPIFLEIKQLTTAGAGRAPRPPSPPRAAR